MECKWDISKTLDVHTYSVYSLAVLDERLASGSNEIIIWNSTDWTQIHYYRGHSGYVTCILTLPKPSHNATFVPSEPLCKVVLSILVNKFTNSMCFSICLDI